MATRPDAKPSYTSLYTGQQMTKQKHPIRDESPFPAVFGTALELAVIFAMIA